MFSAICSIIVVTVLSYTDRKHLNILTCVYARATLPDKTLCYIKTDGKELCILYLIAALCQTKTGHGHKVGSCNCSYLPRSSQDSPWNSSCFLTQENKRRGFESIWALLEDAVVSKGCLMLPSFNHTGRWVECSRHWTDNKALGAGSQTNITQQKLEAKPVNRSRSKVVGIWALEKYYSVVKICESSSGSKSKTGLFLLKDFKIKCLCHPVTLGFAREV